jgi:hypothetical protein
MTNPDVADQILKHCEGKPVTQSSVEVTKIAVSRGSEIRPSQRFMPRVRTFRNYLLSVASVLARMRL